MEKEKLFFKLFEAIKEVKRKKVVYDENWIGNLYSKLLKMNDSMLNLVLDIFSRLDHYSYYNISFIINNLSMLEDMFYKNGNFIDEKLELLYDPYDSLLCSSPIITEYCYINNIPVEEFFHCCFMSSHKYVIESIIKKNDISNSFIAENLDYLFSIYTDSPKLHSTLKLGPLHEMQITIYEKTRPEDAIYYRLKYVHFISYHKYNENVLNKVVNYINNCKFVEYETVEFICAMDIDALDQLIEKYGTQTVLEKILKDEDSHRLCKLSPMLLMNILDSSLSSEKKSEMVHEYVSLNSKQIEAIETLIFNTN